MRNIQLIVSAGLLLLSFTVRANEVEVNQKGDTFSANNVKIKVGDSISFRNDDPHFHDVFSISDAQMFELGSYPQGQAKSVTFKKEGKIEVECAMHPAMKMTVDVTK